MQEPRTTEAVFRRWDSSEDTIEQMFPMKAMDSLELIASTGKTPRESLQDSIDFSLEAWTVECDRAHLAIYGVALDTNRNGVPWFIGSQGLEQLDSIAFSRASRHVVDIWTQEYFFLHNMVLASYTSAHKWLRFLGFTIADSSPVQLEDPAEPFYYFWRENYV